LNNATAKILLVLLMILPQFTLFNFHPKRLLKTFIGLLFCCCCLAANAQISRDSIYSDFVLADRRIQFDQHLRDIVLHQYFAAPPDSENEEKYQEACGAISQFNLQSPDIEKAFASLFKRYSKLSVATRRAFLEAVYAAYPKNTGRKSWD